MPRVLKVHLHKNTDTYSALCGKISENTTQDPEAVTCNTCSGIYRTNLEWYSQVRNKAVEAKVETGVGDIYTRLDVEVGLARIGWEGSAIAALLNNTQIFRNVHILGEPEEDPWHIKSCVSI